MTCWYPYISMETDNNEDPEDQLEREKREQSIRFMRRFATWAGWISFGTIFVAFICFLVTISLLPEDEWASVPGSVVLICLIVLAPLASFIDLFLLLRLATLRATDLGKPFLLGLPGAILSTLLGIDFLLASLA